MLNLYPYLCDDPDMDLSPIRAKSERLYRDILRERQFYAQHPEYDNVHFFHFAKNNDSATFWIDRWGIVVLSLHKGRCYALRENEQKCPAMREKGVKGYYYVGIHKLKNSSFVFIHQLVADVFLPNIDFTKTQMDHINSEHLDNNVLNLERVTPQENIRRREVTKCNKKGQPIPWKYQCPKNYLIYLQSKNSKK